MFYEQSEVAGEIKKSLHRLLENNGLLNNVNKYAEEQFNLPTGILADYYTERLSVKEAKPEIFWYLVNISDFINGNHKLVEKIYTPQEQEAYKDLRYKTLKMDFPIKIKCIPVASDQWIGATDTKFLMKLRSSQLINYNSNAQRLLTQRIVHGNVTYQITVNKSAVKEIRKSFENGTYVPNTITLNIPEEEYDFHYDPKESELVINSLDHFDITDGYHRYIAMSQIFDIDDTFNYPMEIRIIHFNNAKARSMIWQEDQKTRMKKIDADSLNPNIACNRVVEAMNTDPTFYWNGMIARRGGLVNYGELAEVLRYYYYIPAKIQNKKSENQFVIRTPKEIDPKINIAVSVDDRLTTENVDFRDLMIIFYCIKNYEGADIAEHCKKGIDSKGKLSDRFNVRKAGRGVMREVAAICEGS